MQTACFLTRGAIKMCAVMIFVHRMLPHHHLGLGRHRHVHILHLLPSLTGPGMHHSRNKEVGYVDMFYKCPTSLDQSCMMYISYMHLIDHISHVYHIYIIERHIKSINIHIILGCKLIFEEMPTSWPSGSSCTSWVDRRGPLSSSNTAGGLGPTASSSRGSP